MPHNLKVEVDRDVCIGSGDCVRIAPTAFALDDDGFSYLLDPSTVDEETLRLAERSCPSGAITVEAVDSSETTTGGGETMKITATENGPYVIDTGGQKVVLTRGGKEEVIEQTVIALCRCGQSSNKPFCDGTHKAAEFGEPSAEIAIGE
jgi:CDGSH-type Zn-finger protein/ferredoxin